MSPIAPFETLAVLHKDDDDAAAIVVGVVVIDDDDIAAVRALREAKAVTDEASLAKARIIDIVLVEVKVDVVVEDAETATRRKVKTMK